MKGTVKLLRKYRRYDESFRKQLVCEFESGAFSVIQLSRLHGVHISTIYEWIYKYSTFNEKGYRVVEKKASSTEKVKQLEVKVRDLEQALGRKQILIDYLEQLIIQAEEELKVEIKNNYSTPHSDISGKSKKK